MAIASGRAGQVLARPLYLPPGERVGSGDKTTVPPRDFGHISSKTVAAGLFLECLYAHTQLNVHTNLTGNETKLYFHNYNKIP